MNGRVSAGVLGFNLMELKQREVDAQHSSVCLKGDDGMTIARLAAI